MELKGKKVLVCGVARSGIAVASLAAKKGALVTIQDIKNREQMGDISALESMGITLYAGKNADDIIGTMDLAVVSPGIPTSLPFFQIAAASGVRVMSEIEFSANFCPCPIIAITGTNGKTTTTALTGEIIKSAFPDSVVVGNIGVPFASLVENLNNRSYVVAEISSFQMETTQHFHAHISAVLNITPDHLDRHKTLACYQEMKERVFRDSVEEDYVILNFDDLATRSMAARTRAKVFFFSAESQLSEGIFLQDGHIIVKWADWDLDFMLIDDLKVLGTHNHENVMAAIAVGLCAQVPLENIKQAVAGFTGVEHRIEFAGTIHGVDYYNDSKATNTDAAIRGITAMKKPCVLIGGGYDKGADYNEWVAQFDGRVKHLVLIGQTADAIDRCCREHGFTAVTKAETFEEAMIRCRDLADEGDCVLLSPACASWGMFDNYEQRGDMFKEILRRF